MGYESPNVILYDVSGNVLAVQNATAIPASTPALIVAGSDGTNSRYIVVDTSGRQTIVGAGTAGTATGGVVTIQGVAGGVAVPISGTVTATNASVSATGTTIPASATFIGGSVTTAAPTYTNGNLGALSLTTAGLLRIDGSGVTQPISGTVTANAGTGNFAVVQATAANLNATVVQATAANLNATVIGSGNFTVVQTTPGNLRAQTAAESSTGATPPSAAIYIGGSVTTASPTYTTGQMNALSLTTSGALRTDSSATTQPVSGTIAATQSGTWTVQPGNTANTTPWLTTINQGGNSVGVAPANTSATTSQPALVVAISPNTLPQTPADNNATATIVALNGTVIGTTGGCSTIIFDITGTWSATLVFEGQNGDGSWVGLQCYDVTNKLLVTSTATNKMLMIQCGGFPQVRVRASTFASGTVSVTWNAGSGNNINTTSIGQGNNIAVVKGPSTAPVATDQALVVVLSPNQPAIPTTNAPSTSVPNVSTGDIVLSSVTAASIRRTTYTEQTTNFTGSIASANAADAAAGTGARTVKIYYVDSTGATAGTETATLNGTTGVNLVTTTKCFIEKIEVLTAGSSGSNTGIISLYTGANKTGTVVGTIAATDNTTFWAHHYVVTGDVCNVTGVYHGNNSTVAGGTSVAVLKAKDLSVATGVEKQVSDFVGVAGAANPFTRIYGSVIQVTGPARLTMYVTTSSSTSITYRGSFDSYDA